MIYTNLLLFDINLFLYLFYVSIPPFLNQKACGRLLTCLFYSWTMLAPSHLKSLHDQKNIIHRINGLPTVISRINSYFCQLLVCIVQVYFRISPKFVCLFLLPREVPPP